MIVVIDANVWISGLHFAKRRGVPTLALERAALQDTVVTCAEIESEIVRILSHKFGWSKEEIAFALGTALPDVRRIAIEGAAMGCRDRDDDAILECAVIAGATMIVSGDKDLLVLGQFRGIEIISPAVYLARV